MSAVKSIAPIKDRLHQIEAEMIQQFIAEHPGHALVQEAKVLRDTIPKLSAINGTERPAARVGGGLERRLPSRKGKQPKGKVAQHMAATMAVKSIGHPLQTGEILQEMPKHGASISGPNAERNLTSIISKRGDLESVRWRGKRAWWPKGERMPE